MKFKPKFVCYWCKKKLKDKDPLLEIKGNFYCKNCKEKNNG